MSGAGPARSDRCRPRYPGVTFSGFEAALGTLDGFASMPLRRRARLYLNVCDAVNVFAQHTLFEEQKKPSAVANELRKVQLSVDRVARLAEKWHSSAHLHATMHFELVAAVEQWRVKNRAAAANLVSHFELGARTGSIDLGPNQFVRDFFNSAIVMKGVVRTAIKRLENAKAFTSDITAIQSLIGYKLPAVFAGAFGKRFTMTVDSYGRHSKGVDFIIRVFALFEISKRGGSAISPETIKSHYDDARKKGKARAK